MSKNLILNNFLLDLAALHELQKKPKPYELGENLFWNDPYISTQMLKAHLNPNNDAASRRPETIDKIVLWIEKIAGIKAGGSVLDLGCGPGLYASRFAKRGFQVTGVDFSPNSINYAMQYASEQNLQIDYRLQDYLSFDETSKYDTALLIYGDFCPLSPSQRKRLLENVYKALKPGEVFILDVTQFNTAKPDRSRSDWHVDTNGFWRPNTHLVLEQTFSYLEDALYLDQYIIIEEDGTTSTYRVWRQDYTPHTITEELKEGGFRIQSLWGDLTGSPYSHNSEWIGVISQKM
jgi:SAM-dependent methyltransferase